MSSSLQNTSSLAAQDRVRLAHRWQVDSSLHISSWSKHFMIIVRNDRIVLGSIVTIIHCYLIFSTWLNFLEVSRKIIPVSGRGVTRIVRALSIVIRWEMRIHIKKSAELVLSTIVFNFVASSRHTMLTPLFVSISTPQYHPSYSLLWSGSQDGLQSSCSENLSECPRPRGGCRSD